MANGRSLDTTMGFTALDGLVMGTRCGAIDPGVLLYLQQSKGMDADTLTDLLYNRSGLLGVSGVSSDMRDLLDSDAPLAEAAVELFVYRVAREAGALASSLGGLDGIVFTAGIGENAAPVRAAICRRLAWLGVALDDAANDTGAAVISTADSRVRVRVVPTNEERMIAIHVRDLLAATAQGAS
jgi:acetate kinase